MVTLIKKMSKKLGLHPGAMVYVGEHRKEPVTISIIDYDKDSFEERKAVSIEECFAYKEKPSLTWINVNGIHEVEKIEKLGQHFVMHPLVLEDILNTGHRPKMEEADDYIFVVLKMLYLDEENDTVISEQISLVFGKNYVLSFQEREGDVFNSVRSRIEKGLPRARFLQTDYLAYSLLDAIIDNYFVVLEKFGEDIESTEQKLVDNPLPENLETIHDLKRELILMRKRIWPLREVVGALERSESDLIHENTGVYFRDLYEHVIQTIDTVETFREMVSGLLDIYLSSISNKMNEVMKVLTIIATIFIPLSFLAGVYGMNFDTGTSPFNMPELALPYGYIAFWIIALIVGGGLFLYFKKKRWL